MSETDPMAYLDAPLSEEETSFVTVQGPGYALLYRDESWGMARELFREIERMVPRPGLLSAIERSPIVQMTSESWSRPARLCMFDVKDDDEGIGWDWRAMQAARP